MICIAAYSEKKVPTVIKSLSAEPKDETVTLMKKILQSKNEYGKNEYLPGKYSIEFIRLNSDKENVIKTELIKELDSVIVKSYKNQK